MDEPQNAKIDIAGLLGCMYVCPSPSSLLSFSNLEKDHAMKANKIVNRELKKELQDGKRRSSNVSSL